MICSRARPPACPAPSRVHLTQHKMSKRGITYVEHACTREQALHRIMENEKKRWLAPIEGEFPRVEGIQVSEGDPFKKAFFPIARFSAKVQNIRFKGQRIYQEFVTYYDQATKQNRTEIKYNYIPFPMMELEPVSYREESTGFTIACCNFSYDERVEEAFDRSKIKGLLKEYNETLAKAHCDKIFERTVNFADAKALAKSRLKSLERQRAVNEVIKRYGCMDAQIDYFEMKEDIDLREHMLPAYVLQYPRTPPIIVSALYDNNGRVVGGGLLSPTKLAGIAAVAAVAAKLLFPGLGLGFVIASTLLGASCGLKGREWQHTVHEKLNQWNKDQPDEESDYKRTKRSKRRKAEKIEGSTTQEGEILDADPKYFKSLGLNPKEPMTKEKIQKAFLAAIKTAHPDHGGTAAKAQEVFMAKKMLLAALTVD